jgi:hypothetical protein
MKSNLYPKTKMIPWSLGSHITTKGGTVVGGGGALSDGDMVITWLDSSGNGHNAAHVGSPTFKTNIVNGKPVVRVTSASSDGFNLASVISGADPWCIFAVMQTGPASTANAASLIGNDSSRPLGPYIAGSSAVLYTANRDGYQQGTLPSLAFHLFTAKANGGGIGQITFRVDGTLVSIAPTPSPNSGDFAYLGGSTGGNDCDIAEIVMFQGTIISNTDRANMEAYLGAKYGITVTSGGTPVDPSTVTGLAGWWKADSLL